MLWTSLCASKAGAGGYKNSPVSLLVLLLARGGQDPLLTSAYLKQLLDLQSEETPLLCPALLLTSDQQGRLLADFFVLISGLGSPGHLTEQTPCTCSALSFSCPLQTVH